MRTDETLALLRRENPVREDDLAGPEHAVARALKRRILRGDEAAPAPRRRRVAFRLAVAGAAVTAVAFGALSALPGREPSAVERAMAALDAADGTILHTVVLTTRTDRDGTTSTGGTETWRQTAPPYDERVVTRGRELAWASGRPEAYVARTNTIYTLRPDTEVPPRRGAGDDADGLVERMRVLLSSGDAREDGRLRVGGRDAVRIVAGNLTLLVDARTYRPIEWRTVADDGTIEHSRFRTYELLPATAANLALLSVRTQHPGARVEPGISFEGYEGGGGKS
jgi:hypothetical protein